MRHPTPHMYQKFLHKSTASVFRTVTPTASLSLPLSPDRPHASVRPKTRPPSKRNDGRPEEKKRGEPFPYL